MMTTIDLLRHGESAPGVCLGRDFDAPLTATGWTQMRTAVASIGVIINPAPKITTSVRVEPVETRPSTSSGRTEFKGRVNVWDGVVSSPLIRCAEFAAELAGHRNLPLRYEPDFRELGFGAWEGRHWADLYAEVGEPLLAFQAQPGFNPAPGGEHYADFESRIFAAWTRLLQTARGGHWLLIAHAGVIRAILRLLLGFPARRLFAIAVPYAGLTRIEQQGDSLPRLVFHRGGG